MTKNEFKQGDRVRSKVAIFAVPAGRTGVITSILPNGRYKVRLDGEKDWYAWYVSNDLELVEPLDRRTAFLTELQALLRKYDARIYDDECTCIIDLGIHGDKSERIKYTDSDWELNADNIMDFDKE